MESYDMKQTYLMTIFFIASCCCLADSQSGQWSTANPDKSLFFHLSCRDGRITYHVESIDKNGTSVMVIDESPLGLTRRDADFTSGMSFVSESETRAINETYSMLTGKQSRIQVEAVEKIFTFTNPSGSQMQIIVRVSSDGAAFRYRFPEQNGHLHFVTEEATGFKVPADGHAWLMPYAKVGIWAPAYENDWQNNVSIGTSSPEEVGWAMPALFHTAGHWILISEADASCDFYAVHLQQQCKSGLYRVRLPEKDETYGVAPQEAYSILPWTTPWRVLIIGKDLGIIMESTLITDLARPSVIEDTSWIRPGRVSWSWWSEPSSPNNYEKLVLFVDLAAKLGWEYSLIDLGWQDMKNGGDIRKLVDYAASKGVGIILWYNSGGKHNKVDGNPRDIMHDPVKRAAEMEKIRSWGVKGVKVDFLQSDKQYIMKMYEDILRDAARYHLVVDFHGCTIPRGWSRTYPNLLSMEAVRGAEQYWDETFAENAQTFHTIYTFTRNVVGPMDYTPVIFNDPPDKKKHLTTNAHELALSVAFESGLLHFVDTPDSYLSQPKYVTDFLKIVPVTWDEIRYLSGTPGEMVLLARRKGSDWFIAGLNGTREEKTVNVPLKFLGEGPYDISVITDGPGPRQFNHISQSITRDKELTIRMAPRGGFTGVLKK
jgi:alpha-glucosidase